MHVHHGDVHGWLPPRAAAAAAVVVVVVVVAVVVVVVVVVVGGVVVAMHVHEYRAVHPFVCHAVVQSDLQRATAELASTRNALLELQIEKVPFLGDGGWGVVCVCVCVGLSLIHI